ncbi:MAG TPA: energy transducer TonB [Gammaproteobacteria bacterium]|nr:energy transducer TonB [Gammaproteobacteria bacterium]
MTTTPHITSNDRISMTIFLAIAIHAIIILGVTFNLKQVEDETDRPLPTMEITLVHHSSEKTVTEGDFLAQVSQEGGGSSEEKLRLSSPVSIPSIAVEPSDSDTILPPTSPQSTIQQSDPTVIAHSKSDFKLQENKEPARAAPETMDAAELIKYGMKIASLQAEISQELQTLTMKKGERTISATSTLAYRDAAYLEAWQSKIERIGTLNYPEEAKRRAIVGRLTVDVAINPDGSVEKVTILQPSGHKLLDDAVKRIVQLAAPFAPFSEEMRKDTKILHIQRTWKFLPNNNFEAR